MSVVPKVLINAKLATAADEYTVPANTTTIIDKFTVYNTTATAGTYTLDIHIIPSGESATLSNKLLVSSTFAANETREFPLMQNQILKAGDIIRVVPSLTGVLSIRCSGREVT